MLFKGLLDPVFWLKDHIAFDVFDRLSIIDQWLDIVPSRHQVRLTITELQEQRKLRQFRISVWILPPLVEGVLRVVLDF